MVTRFGAKSQKHSIRTPAAVSHGHSPSTGAQHKSAPSSNHPLTAHDRRKDWRSHSAGDTAMHVRPSDACGASQ